MTAATLLPVSLGVLVGAGTQRVTGVGFALVAGPLLVLLLGPVEGVRLVNLLSLLSSMVVLPTVWREVEFRRVARLAVPALLVLPAGAWIARNVPGAPLMIAEGVLVLTALYGLHRFNAPRALQGRAGETGAGAASGLMNVTAGIGGPAITLYAAATRWEHKSFVASMQLYTVLVNAGSIAAKGWPQLPYRTLAIAAACALAGVALGHKLEHRVSRERARRAVLAIAALGGVTAILKGVITV
ncbi:sulfite exporter TauE/SafE family protein [Actinomadura vinacea]|uniref:Probable membrane transporter protein n=1 Tax=Actinomadura vinacea TaxID=115336 RepID=A0ABN3IXT5_9ACTN